MTVLAQRTPRRCRAGSIRHETLLAGDPRSSRWRSSALLNDRFLTLDNLLNQGRLMTEVGLIALPMTFVIITGGIDLSVGSIVGLCAIVLGYSWKNFGFPLPLAIVFALGVGASRASSTACHHARESAAADHDDRHARALSRPRRRDQPGPFGARLSRMVLLHRAGRVVRRADAALGCSARRSSSPASRSTARRSAARSTRSAPTRRRRAFPAFRVDRIKLLDLHAVRA